MCSWVHHVPGHPQTLFDFCFLIHTGMYINIATDPPTLQFSKWLFEFTGPNQILELIFYKYLSIMDFLRGQYVIYGPVRIILTE
jgi:hypothetical protein